MDAAHERPRVWTDVSALMALCAGLRLAFVRLVPRTLDSADAVAYLETARLLATGDLASIDPKIPVLYPAVVALVHQLIPDVESAGRAVSWIFSTLLVGPVYLLARELHGRAVARVACVLIAFWPWLIDYGSRVATEPLAVFLFLSGVCAITVARRSPASMGWMTLAGTCFGLLHLARPEGTFVYVAAPASLLIFGMRRLHRPTRMLVAYAMPGLLAIGAGMAITYAASGDWSVNYRLAFIGEQPEGSTVPRDLVRTLVGLSADVPAVMLGPLLWAFFGIGVAAPGTSSRDSRAEISVLFFAVVQWLVVLPVVSPAPRYLMAAFVICVIWSARGIERSASAIAASRKPTLARIPLAAVVLWMIFHSTAHIASERVGPSGDVRPAQPWEFQLAGEWMRENLDPGPIVTRKPQIGFYADMPTIGPAAEATLDEIFAMAKAGGMRYLVVDERYTADLIPALKPLLDPGAAPRGLRLVSDDLSPYRAARLVIYEFESMPEKQAP